MTTTTLQGAVVPGTFPVSFRFGVAMAAYQIEGAVNEDGRGASIWDAFCRRPGAVSGGDTGDVACDHYHRWSEDLDLMAALGIESYRFSISWPRVQPDGRGALNRLGVDFYKRLCAGLRERGIEPVATLYHWDLPLARQAVGGWAVRDTAERFAEYAALMAGELDVDAWITHNEPWVVAFLGHAEGVKAPGIRDWPTALLASHHLLLSHGLAAQALHGKPRGITLNLAPVRSGDPMAAARMDGYLNRWFLDPVFRGSYPEDMVERYERRYGPFDVVRDGDLAVISEPIDFLGINYYFPQRVRSDPARQPLEISPVLPPPPTTAMGWEVDPDGLHELLLRVRRDYGNVPIYITENGAAFEDGPVVNGTLEDPRRVEYLESHLSALARAVADGVDVRRYFAWSMLDNFEWEHGYSKRFGLVYVDYATQRRVPKRSGLWYRDFIASTAAQRS
jgi:beta-glucosidase